MREIKKNKNIAYIAKELLLVFYFYHRNLSTSFVAFVIFVL